VERKNALRALPGGPLTQESYRKIKLETLRRLSGAGPIDGIVLANHDALEVADLDIDGDTDFVLAIRRQLGPDVPMRSLSIFMAI
jgi:microcystin degradation protein MlrC